jgi:hypothetical protein
MFEMRSLRYSSGYCVYSMLFATLRARAQAEVAAAIKKIGTRRVHVSAKKCDSHFHHLL